MLTTSDELKAETSAVSPNLLAAGQIGGKTYGIPIGANTLALHYNKEVLDKAGVDTATIKDWTTLTAALRKVEASGKKGITFSAIGAEEGSFQFLPWFWGAGASLTQRDSPPGVAALTLWTGWLKQGYAPNSVLNNTQSTSWQEFATDDFAFSENGTWQLTTPRRPASNTASSRSRPRPAVPPRRPPAASSSPPRSSRTPAGTTPRRSRSRA